MAWNGHKGLSPTREQHLNQVRQSGTPCPAPPSPPRPQQSPAMYLAHPRESPSTGDSGRLGVQVVERQ